MIDSQYIPKLVIDPRPNEHMYSAHVYEKGKEILTIQNFHMPGDNVYDATNNKWSTVINKHSPSSMVGYTYGTLDVPRGGILKYFYPIIHKTAFVFVSEYDPGTGAFTFVLPIPNVKMIINSVISHIDK